MPVPTSNYSWQKPDVGASNDVWGGLINSDLDGIDATVKTVSDAAAAAQASASAALPSAGGTVTGPVTFNGTATFAAAVTCTLGGPSGGFVVDTAAGNARNVIGKTAGKIRWAVQLGNLAPETGANVGSDFQIAATADDGATPLASLFIRRATGTVYINGIGATSPALIGTPGIAVFALNKALGQVNALNGYTNGVSRWGLQLGDNTAEGGSNSGSNLSVLNFNDAGTQLATPLSISRATGTATFSVAIINGPSDRSLKENIAPIEGGLDKVLALSGVAFNMIATPDKPKSA